MLECHLLQRPFGLIINTRENNVQEVEELVKNCPSNILAMNAKSVKDLRHAMHHLFSVVGFTGDITEPDAVANVAQAAATGSIVCLASPLPFWEMKRIVLTTPFGPDVNEIVELN